MDNICRICCTKKIAKNYIFSDDNALYLKMFYLPVKILRNDLLPQNVCDKCSFKINDFYQFCNETIEAQKKLKSKYLPKNRTDGLIDLTIIKEDLDSPKCVPETQDHSTQTEPDDFTTKVDRSPDNTLEIKEEPINNDDDNVPSVKYEYGSDNFSGDNWSDSSDDISLVNLKKKKSKRKNFIENGHASPKTRKCKKEKNWEKLIRNISNSVMEEPGLELETKNFDVNLEEMHTCCICFKKCYSRTEILRHYRSHAKRIGKLPEPPPIPDQRPLRCSRCSKILEVNEWKKHWNYHLMKDFRPYSCALCEKSFKETQLITKHGLTHKHNEDTKANQQKRFVCDLCPEEFIYMKYLLSHRTVSHPEASSRALELRCLQCSRTFSHMNSLRRHLKSHTGEKNHLCNICGKALSSREHLKFHMSIHTGFKPHICKTCGKGFVKKCNLKLHERVHTKEKPYVCSDCGKAFSQRSTLVIHERYHSGARPYVCDLCNRGFVARGLLSMHAKTCCL